MAEYRGTILMGGDDMAKTKYKIILSDDDIEMLNSILADDESSDSADSSADLWYERS